MFEVLREYAGWRHIPGAIYNALCESFANGSNNIDRFIFWSIVDYVYDNWGEE